MDRVRGRKERNGKEDGGGGRIEGEMQEDRGGRRTDKQTD